MSEAEKKSKTTENSSTDNKEAIEVELTKEQLDAIIEELDGVPNIDEVEDTLFENRIIYLNGAIDGELVSQIVPLIKYFNLLDDKEGVPVTKRSPIKIYVNSEGGEAYEGLGLVNAIINSKTPVWTYNEGTISYSMSFLIFLAGHKRFMGRFSFLLYHQLRGASETKTLVETRTMLNHYEEMQDMMDEFIVERTSVPMNKLKSVRNKNMDWYISYNEASKYKMFDEVL